MKKEKEEVQQTGACRFCGQAHIMIADGELTQPQAEEKATRICECEEAVKYTDKATKGDRSRARINEVFGEGAGERRLRGEIIQEITALLDLILDKSIKEVVITVQTGEKARLKMTAKDKVKIERSKNNVTAFEE